VNVRRLLIEHICGARSAGIPYIMKMQGRRKMMEQDARAKPEAYRIGIKRSYWNYSLIPAGYLAEVIQKGIDDPKVTKISIEKRR
jgi:hypothetical protein